MPKAGNPEWWLGGAGVCLAGLFAVLVAVGAPTAAPGERESAQTEAKDSVGDPDRRGGEKPAATAEQRPTRAHLGAQAVRSDARTEPLAAQVAELTKERDALRSRLTTVEARLTAQVAAASEARDALQTRLTSAEASTSRLRRELAEGSNERQAIAESRQRLQQSVNRLLTQRATLDGRLKSAKTEAEASRAELIEKDRVLQEALEVTQESRETIKTQNARIAQLRHRLRKREEQLALMRGGQSPDAEPSRASKRTAGPREFVEAIGQRMLTGFPTDVSSPQARTGAALGSMLSDFVDIDDLIASVLGTSWTSATPKQQDEYRVLFTDYVMRPFLRFMGDTGIRAFEVVELAAIDRGVTRVDTRVATSSGDSLDWSWVVRQKGNEYRAVDVSTNGISVLAVYKSELGAFKASRGVEELIRKLRHKAGTPLEQ